MQAFCEVRAPLRSLGHSVLIVYLKHTRNPLASLDLTTQPRLTSCLQQPPHLSLPNARTIIYGSLDVSFYLNFDFIFFPSCVAYIYEYMCVWGMLACVCADGGQTSTPRALSSALHLTFWDRSSHWGWGPPFPLDLLTCGPPCVYLSCAGIAEVCYHTPCLRGCWG